MTLAKLTEADCDFILPWRNAPKVRQAMYTHHEISLDEHRSWFRRMESDPTAHWFLYHDAEGEPTGVVYFTDVDMRQSIGFWGFYASPGAMPGAGLRMELEALEHAFGQLGLSKLSCEVLSTNGPVINLHKKVGFVEEGVFRQQHFDGQQRVDITRLGMLANEWPVCRGRLRARIEKPNKLTPPLAQTGGIIQSITLLSDADSWINEYIEELALDWIELGYCVNWVHEIKNMSPADLCFCLGCGQMMPAYVRKMYRHTLVVHESALPQGKGWSPLTWQILEGKNRIVVTLIEAVEAVDSGSIYAQHWLEFEGHELIDELRTAQAKATAKLCQAFVGHYPLSAKQGADQQGDESFYPRRRPEDSELDVQKTLAEQFDLLRIVDNDRYPAYFTYHNRKYRLKIHKVNQGIRDKR